MTLGFGTNHKLMEDQYLVCNWFIHLFKSTVIQVPWLFSSGYWSPGSWTDKRWHETGLSSKDMNTNLWTYAIWQIVWAV